MIKKLAILLACFGLAFQVTSCTSKNNQSDSDIAADMDAADLERLEGDDALEIAADDSLLSDHLPEDALGETHTDTSLADTTPSMDVADVGDSLPADPFAETTETTPSYTESTPSYSADSYASSETATSVADNSTTFVDNEAPAPKVNIPLQKVAAEPWKVGKSWFNTVYFARPGDTLAGISEKIYGSDRTSELKRGNPTYASREVRPGDKVYYNSPNRPDDNAKVLTYFEDNGMTPEVYVAQSGDNIRTLSKDLLGYDGAWKEVWSSNTVDSKGALQAGTELRYWRSAGGAAMAQNNQQQAPTEDYSQRQEVVGSIPPPPAQDAYQDQYMNQGEDYSQQAQGDIPPPPMPEMDHGDMAPPPPPPSDYAYDNNMAPPPPPPVESINPPAPPQQHLAEDTTGVDNDSTMVLGIVGIAAAGLAALVVIRKKRRQRELEQQAMDNTHVGT
ncbi:hypothetical protein BDW_00265 [Bdellovibrio bacteriovorus W]|nr:hypothetical protein BDW_00265 [Bdellovibrio bacteriovorus W]